MNVIKKPKKWYVKLFTLGDKFSSQTFSDNTKKFSLNAIGLFVVVTFTFYVESVGDDYENRKKYVDVAKGILEELYMTSEYTDNYIERIDLVSAMYRKQYDRWEIDNDSIFIDYQEDEKEPDGKYYFAPMAIYGHRDPYTPPRVKYDTFSKGNQDFFLINPEISNLIYTLYEGTGLKHLIEDTGKVEMKYIDKFFDRVDNKWSADLPWIDIDHNEFWIQNRKYIQNDKYIKFNLNRRLDLWEYNVKEELSYQNEIIKEDIKALDSIIQVMDNEKHFLYWKID
ncbi:hypothetical protein N9I15_01965 [Flavobacteriaceae bacterium]|jgi:hypothetical protein|nr:hypothetical protein [Flavobacteriaceae bacterium]MDA9851575.1 hypothetical protein [Flavobacteriaceae bacterium]